MDPSSNVQPRLQGIFENYGIEPSLVSMETTFPERADANQKTIVSSETIQSTQPSDTNNPSTEHPMHINPQKMRGRQQSEVQLNLAKKDAVDAKSVQQVGASSPSTEQLMFIYPQQMGSQQQSEAQLSLAKKDAVDAKSDKQTGSDKPGSGYEEIMPERQAFPFLSNHAPLETTERIQATIALVESLKMSDKKDMIKLETRPYASEQSPVRFTLNTPLGATSRQTPTEDYRLPAIKIHIGRIEIRALKETPPPIRKMPENPKPAMSLEQYLKERKG